MPILLVVLFSFLLAGPVYAKGCDGIKADLPNIEVKLVKKEIEFSHNISAQQLTASHNGNLGAHEANNGRTEHKLNTNSLTSVKNFMHNNNKICTVLHKIDITVSQSLIVHIASNYEKDSCPYIAVMNHELEHVAINNKHVNNYVASIKSELIKIWDLMPPHPLMDDKRFNHVVSTRLTALQEKFMAEAKLDNLIIDTPGSYASVHKKCKNWPQIKK